MSGALRIGATTARVPSAIVPEPSPDRQRNAINSRAKLSPRTALNALAVGHTLWGTYAYRDQLAGIVADVPGSVGDGIFDKEHSRDARTAAYWFLFVGPLLTVIARLYDSAETAGDRPAMRSAARILLGTSVAGLVTIPRSGFPGGIALGLWLMRRAGRARPE